MTNKKLLDNVAKLGFPMLQTEEEFDVNETIAQVVMSNDIRLWEGFPVLLINATNDYHFSLKRVERMVNRLQIGQLQKLVLLSLAVYATQNLTLPWANKLLKDLDDNDKDKVKRWRNMLDHGQSIVLNDIEFDPQRLKNAFDLYFEQSGEQNRRRKEKYEEYSLEYALSQIFSPKQKDIFKKKLEGLPLTKTENEYYSRKVKKKVIALSNSDLHAFARKLLEQ